MAKSFPLFKKKFFFSDSEVNNVLYGKYRKQVKKEISIAYDLIK